MIELNWKQDGSPVLRAIFSEVNCVGYIEGKALLIAPYSSEGVPRTVWRTSGAPGLKMPLELLAAADEVIK